LFFAGGKSISPITPFGMTKKGKREWQGIRLDSNLPLKHRPSINSFSRFTLYNS